MGNNLFNANISGLVNSIISPFVLDAVLIKRTPGTRTPGSITGGTNPTETSYTAKGFVDFYDDDLIDETNVKTGDRKVTLIGDSIADLSIPENNDKVTIEGQTWTIVKVNRDPDAATYDCQSRL